MNYLIVGQGIAGAFLANNLLKKRKEIVIYNNDYPGSSTRTAAGMFGPMAGKGFSPTWKADKVIPNLIDTVADLELRSGKKILHHRNIFKTFHSEEEYKLWDTKVRDSDFAMYTEKIVDESYYGSYFNNPFGGAILNSAGYINIQTVLEIIEKELREKSLYIDEPFDYSKLKVDENYIEYKGFKPEAILFCEGYKVQNNPYFSWVPPAWAKGELLTVKVEGLPKGNIFKSKIHLGEAEDGNYFLGSTFEWDLLDEQITLGAREKLETGLKHFLKVPYQIIGQRAGIRPCSRDRRPYIGTHPVYSRLKIFNGLGTKGVMLAPFLAKHFSEVLVDGERLIPEADINRFYKLYKA